MIQSLERPVLLDCGSKYYVMRLPLFIVQKCQLVKARSDEIVTIEVSCASSRTIIVSKNQRYQLV